MTYYVCVTIGQSDFMPDDQIYLSANTRRELCDLVANECRGFNDESYRHPFTPPYNPNVTNWSQRLRIAKNSDLVLDVIGMTSDEFER